MRRQNAPWVACVMSALFPLCGCLGDPDLSPEPEEESTDLVRPLVTGNSLTTNSLTTNSLTTNSLTTNSLTASRLVMSSLAEPASREVLSYIVSCALPSDRFIEIESGGTVYRYDGSLGLAPEWSRRACDESCQVRVSSCVIARVNHRGQRVELSLRGEDLPTTAAESRAFQLLEGAYLGNIFRHPQVLQACVPFGRPRPERTCGPSSGQCFLDVVSCACLLQPSRVSDHYEHCQFPGWRSLQDPLTVFLRR
jgi:hypothetical protein